MGVDLGTFLTKHPEYLPDQYKGIILDEATPDVLRALFLVLSAEAQRAYRGQIHDTHLDDRLPGVMEGGQPRNS